MNQSGHIRWAQSEVAHQFSGRIHGIVRRSCPNERAALDDGTMEEAFGLRHCKQNTDFTSAAGFAEDRNVVWIPPKLRDVLAHPLQCRDQVELASVSRFRVRWVQSAE